ncbi:hypothetical protein CIL05_05345 [Virgibacillus profundi]|uniref:Uncharacterized protein n=1 Tax=Virgibacillus profundi TaxID=2024555 RepID=A0A2A2IFU4_9BACI|nr:hypothetical protein [Virgibacillus profundi]PAV30527.1 hypothetical protein CIL05_05345 [Virgibacillus profundi]PXY54699.1 hypothetical protein CIT14_05430 [Virgibacillus profundi]
MKSTLQKLASELNNHNILWGLGGSAMLYHYQITDVVNDIDILIDEQHAEEVESIISAISKKEEAIRKEPFATKHFQKYNYEDTSIDIMGGFQIYHEQGLYTLGFDQASITAIIVIDNIRVPFSSLEDWYILYSLIPGKQYKADLIEDYWKANSIQHPNLLKRALQKPLPGYVVNNLERLQC